MEAELVVEVALELWSPEERDELAPGGAQELARSGWHQTVSMMRAIPALMRAQ